MKGSAHLTIGGAAGLAAAMYLHTDPLATASLVGIGAVSGLAPDLDVNGKLSNRITISKKWLILFFALAGGLLAIYSYWDLSGMMQLAGILIGSGLILLPRLFIKQRTMLFLTGAAIGYAGFYMDLYWMMLLSGFIIVSSFLSHRTLTHSVIGLVYFGYIAWHFEQSVQVEGSFIAAVLAYASHLVADMKAWSFNKKGVKWFQPFVHKEF
ncbi:metal-dependent hydrolase [Bacillus xiapuensis]|uniref:metal-dependent hydrolase n=1 Tax=Bacillus xiapuensis TaxID=2014075 RepID=UPI000C23ACBA|nr:metal-dependent hydrolase [Bacillus xiapuensis]